MSKRKLPQLKESHSNLMSHIADFVTQCTNLLNKGANQNAHALIDGMEAVERSIADYMSKLAIIFIPGTTANDKDEQGLITGIETDDNMGQLPLLTADELQALKLFLADYQRQFELAKGATPLNSKL